MTYTKHKAAIDAILEYVVEHDGGIEAVIVAQLEAAIKAEREACAKLCEVVNIAFPGSGASTIVVEPPRRAWQRDEANPAAR